MHHRPMITSNPSRRNLLKTAVAAAAFSGVSPAYAVGPATAPATQPHGDPWLGLKVGITTYTFKQRPLEPTIAAIKRVGLAYVSIKDFHLPLKSTAEERKEVAQKFKASGITPMSCGVISLKGTEKENRQAFDYARDAGIPTIVCSPTPNVLPDLEKLVKEYDIRIAIHNHGPEDKIFPSPNEVWDAVQKLDPRMGLCIDVGHSFRAGVDPAAAIRKYKDRLFDLHFKDNDSNDPHAKPVEVGRGVMDIRGMLQALLDIRYPYEFSFEFEKDMDDPLPGLAESVGFTKGVLSTLKA